MFNFCSVIEFQVKLRFICTLQFLQRWLQKYTILDSLVTSLFCLRIVEKKDTFFSTMRKQNKFVTKESGIV